DLSQYSVLTTAFLDADDNLWLGAASKGLLRLDKKTGDITVFDVCDDFNPVDLYRTCRWITNIVQDSDGSLWLATNDGLVHFNPQRGTSTVWRIAKEIVSLFKD